MDNTSHLRADAEMKRVERVLWNPEKGKEVTKRQTVMVESKSRGHD